jgi:hypothetical protein
VRLTAIEAEREGFEPSVGLNALHRISNPAQTPEKQERFGVVAGMVAVNPADTAIPAALQADVRLARLVAAWPALAEAVQERILSLLDSPEA